MTIHIDPDGRFAVRAATRSAELWIVERIAFDTRPPWQSAPDGPVAHLHRALSGLKPQPGDVLACIWACSDETNRPDVENRLFTNVLPKIKSATPGPNPFADLPSRIRFERSFQPAPTLEAFSSEGCLYYRYALVDQDSSWGQWRAKDHEPPLASWSDVPATGLSTGNGWATWASMRRPGAQIVARSLSEPHRDDFALHLSISSPAPLQLVANLEWIIDGVIASFQRVPDRERAEVIASLLQPRLDQHGLTHDLVDAQCAAPRLFAPPPFHLHASHKRCSIRPADDQLVAGDIQLRIAPQLKAPVLTGELDLAERV